MLQSKWIFQDIVGSIGHKKAFMLIIGKKCPNKEIE